MEIALLPDRNKRHDVRLVSTAPPLFCKVFWSNTNLERNIKNKKAEPRTLVRMFLWLISWVAIGIQVAFAVLSLGEFPDAALYWRPSTLRSTCRPLK